MADKIYVRYIIVAHRRFFDPHNQYKEKELHEVITVGRANDNDIQLIYPWISNYHGRIFLEQGFFTEHLDYEDYSSNGSVVIHWNSFAGKSEYVHKKKVKIKPGSWILIQNNGEEGLILIPFII